MKDKIIKHLEENPSSTIYEIGRAIGIEPYRVAELVCYLMAEGKVTSDGLNEEGLVKVKLKGNLDA